MLLRFCWYHVSKRCREQLAVEAADFAGAESNHARQHGKQGVVTTPADILARSDLGSPLADDDCASRDFLASVDFGTQAFGLGIAAETSCADAFNVCHTGG